VQAQQQAAAVVVAARALQIVDEATNAQGLEMLAQARKQTKTIDALRRKFVDPLNKHIKDINAFFKEGAAPLEEADRILTKKTRDWRAKVDEANRAAEAKLKAQAEAQHARDVAKAEAKGQEPPPCMPIVPTVAPPAKTVATETGTVTFVERWSFEITDAALVPRELCCPDEKKIGQMVRAKAWQPDAAPAGVRITVSQEPTVR
jgi:hypothetical protein